jgi:hypothetical protein
MEQVADGISSLRMANEMNWMFAIPHPFFPLLRGLSEENCCFSAFGYPRVAVRSGKILSIVDIDEIRVILESLPLQVIDCEPVMVLPYAWRTWHC